MNEKASEIGMTNSNFANSSGINDPDNYSTVRDIAIMSKYLIKNYPEYYKLLKKQNLPGIEQAVTQLLKEIEIHYYIKELVLTV